MLHVFIPTHFYAERHYALQVMLEIILGLKVHYTVYEESAVQLSWEGGDLIFEDAFWKNYSESEYVNQASLPQAPQWLNYEELSRPLPVIYGKAHVKPGHCYADVVASAFFMLTRWEESVKPDRDKHDRFIGKASYAFQYQLLDRAIVHEYADFIGLLLTEAGYQLPKVQRTFKEVFTHDLDIPYKWSKFSRLAVSLGGDVLKRKSPFLALQTLTSFIQTRFLNAQDPFDVYDLLMDISEANNSLSQFNLMASTPSKWDEGYDLNHPKIKKIIQNIQARGHQFGFHPGYDTFLNPTLWNHQKNTLEQSLGQQIQSGRQHFLRFKAPDTWQLWADMSMTSDSSAAYADVAGFRCGMCIPFPVFNFKTRKMLTLYEHPLIAMEVTLAEYQGHSPEQFLSRINTLKNEVKRHHGEFVWLWHNHSFNTPFWKKYQGIYLDTSFLDTPK